MGSGIIATNHMLGLATTTFKPTTVVPGQVAGVKGLRKERKVKNFWAGLPRERKEVSWEEKRSRGGVRGRVEVGYGRNGRQGSGEGKYLTLLTNAGEVPRYIDAKGIYHAVHCV